MIKFCGYSFKIHRICYSLTVLQMAVMFAWRVKWNSPGWNQKMVVKFKICLACLKMAVVCKKKTHQSFRLLDCANTQAFVINQVPFIYGVLLLSVGNSGHVIDDIIIIWKR